MNSKSPALNSTSVDEKLNRILSHLIDPSAAAVPQFHKLPAPSLAGGIFSN